MIQPSKSMLLASVCASLLVAAPGWAQSPLGPAKRDGVWGQAYSDIKPDPAVRFGQLPNGLRYAIMHNATPGRQASLRLRIGAGSLQERDDQQGLAHFLEHMAFKGSTHVAENEMVKILQRKGLAFGPDTNAFTSFEQTVYMLDLPETDADTLDTGLMLLRETAGELTLSQSAMDAERGVILSEERLRDSPSYQAQKSELAFLLAGQRVPTRWPIGSVEVIKTAPVSRVRAYYEANYRPDNATVIAVGDFDPDLMEAKIKARFGDWKAKAPAPAPVDLGAVAQRGESVHLFVKPGASQTVQLAFAGPYDPTADTTARERRDAVETLGLAVLNRRLDLLAHQPKPPFVSAQADRRNTLNSVRLTQLEVSTTPQGWREGLQAAVIEMRRAVRFGVRPDELQREIEEQRASLTTAAAGAATRKTPQTAEELVQTVNENEVYNGPVSGLQLWEGYVKGLTVGEVNAALKAAFAGQGPLISMTTPQAVEGGEAALKAAFDQAATAPVAAGVAAAARAWPYASFGAPGKVVERREVADLGITLVRFANGVRVTIKPTRFAKDQVLVGVRVGEGRIALSRTKASPTWAVSAVVRGGTQQLTTDEIDQALATRVVNARLAVADDAYQFSGGTRPQDFATELQLITAYLAEPAFRPEAFLRQQAALATALPQLDSTPGGVQARDGALLLHDGDVRWRVLPSKAELDAATPDQLPALIGASLKSGAVEATIVGDVSVDQAIAVAASTLGALPPRATPDVAALARAEGGVRFPAAVAQPVVETHKGRADQAIALIGWPTQDFFADPRTARGLAITGQILENRLVDRLRVAEGATYSPNAASSTSDVLPGYGYLSAQVETPPARIDSFYTAVEEIAADLRVHAPTADELERAKKPEIETRLKQEQTNEFWLQRLGRAQTEPRMLEAVRSQVAQYQAVTPADVQRLAACYLTNDKAWKLVIRAAEPTPDVKTPAPGG